MTDKALQYQLIATAHKPTSVYASISGNFIHPNHVSLIVAKCNRLETYNLRGNGLELLGEHIIHGRNSGRDHLVVLTEKRQFSVWSWNVEHGYLEVEFSGEIEGKSERPLETGSMLTVDPFGRCIAILGFQGIIHLLCISDNFSASGSTIAKQNISKLKNPYKIIKLGKSDGKGREKELTSKEISQAVECRVEELKVLDMLFLEESRFPVLSILYEDSIMIKHIKTYRVNISKSYPNSGHLKAKLENHWNYRNIHHSCNFIVSDNSGGLVAIGNDLAVYIDDSGNNSGNVRKKESSSIVLNCSQISTATWINNDSNIANMLSMSKKPYNPNENFTREKLLVGDEDGILWLLIIEKNKEDSAIKMFVEKLGDIPVPRSLSYIQSGILFVGSHYSDSRLVKLHNLFGLYNTDPWSKLGNSNSATSSLVETLQVMSNLGPITDMCMIQDSPKNTHNIFKPRTVKQNFSVDDRKYELAKDSGQKGNERLVTCSGGRSKPSLRVIRNGIGIKVRVSVDMACVCGIWSVAAHGRNSSNNNSSVVLVMSLPNYTSIFELVDSGKNSENSLEFNEIQPEANLNSGWIFNSKTIWVGNTGNNTEIIQVTDQGINVIKGSDYSLIDSWTLSSNSGQIGTDFNTNGETNTKFSITFASGYKEHLVVSLRGGIIIYFQVCYDDNNNLRLVEVNKLTLNAEISCIDLNKVPKTEDERHLDNHQQLPLLAVGTWGSSKVVLYELPAFEQIDKLEVFQGQDNERDIPESDSNQNSQNDTSHTKEKNNVEKNHHSSQSLNNIYTLSSENLCLVRSVLFTRLENQTFILVGLSNGRLVYCPLLHSEKSNHVSTNHSKMWKLDHQFVKSMSLGTYPIGLTPFKINSRQHVFISSDKPAIMYSFGSKPLFSHVNTKDVLYCCSLIPDSGNFINSKFGEGLSKSICITDNNYVTIANVEQVQKLHVDTIPLNPWEMSYKIAHHQSEQVVALCSIALLPTEENSKQKAINQESNTTNVIQEEGIFSVLDDLTFETLARVKFSPYELPESVASVRLTMLPRSHVSQAKSNLEGHKNTKNDNSFNSTDINQKTNSVDVIAVGTAITLPNDDDALSGFIYLYTYDRLRRHLTEIFKIKTKGAVYSIAPYKGMLLAAINNKVVLYAWRAPSSDSLKQPSTIKSRSMNSVLDINLEILSIEPTHVVSLHLAVPASSNNYALSINETQEILENPNSDFLGVGDLMTGVSVIQHKSNLVSGNINGASGTKMSLHSNDVDNNINDLESDESKLNEQMDNSNSSLTSSFSKGIKRKNSGASYTKIQHRIEEVDRETFNNWVTSLACLESEPDSLGTLQVNPFNTKLEVDQRSGKKNFMDKKTPSLRFLVGENGLNLYSLSYGATMLHEISEKLSTLSISNLTTTDSLQPSTSLDKIQEPKSSHQDEPNAVKLQLTGRYHLGDLANVIVPGSLVMQNSMSEVSVASPNLLIGTISGAVHVCVDILNYKLGRVLDRLQTNMAVLGPSSFCGYTVYSHKYSSNLEFYSSFRKPKGTNTSGVEDVVGDFFKSPQFAMNHVKYRTFLNLQKIHRPFGFIDGDLVMLFLDYPYSLQKNIFNGGYRFDNILGKYLV
ncbi:hypothetical protein BB558_002291 [Smittium angustum]|uniref:Cleavage/polyadenylation specificity factor A subunit C-terminal domain-containing protein n=1 Tax=Smittium angustum TaxID=133377 RepID=A0A2U1J9E9_SMIAN|nr:hypothetical protein BB558_005750 [Smittium angustum]PWA01593.1 hypothetical protein BB558_002291 [Smittium angustum]